MKLTDEWSTPSWLFDQLNEIYGPFNFDACADKNNAKCEKYFTLGEDGLYRNWNARGKIFLNPPYSDPKPWVQKALRETEWGVTTGALLPFDPSTKWFQQFILNRPNVKIVEMFPWRIKFVPPPKWKGAVCGPRGAHCFVLFTPMIKRQGTQHAIPDRDGPAPSDTASGDQGRSQAIPQ